MTLEYQTRQKDYIDFYEFNATQTPQGKKSMRTQKYAVPVILFLVLLATMVFGVGKLFVAIQIILYAVFSWMWAKNQDKMIRKNAESLLARLEKKDQTPYSPKGTISFEEKEITDKRASETITLHYSDIASVYENNGALYVYMREGNRVILLPAPVLAADNAREEVLIILRKKVAPENIHIF